jgi:hypothetical protein
MHAHDFGETCLAIRASSRALQRVQSPIRKDIVRDIVVPPEIERALVEEARRLGTTPELLAVDSLRERFTPLGTEKKLIKGQGTLADFLSDHIGVLHSSEFVAGGA